MLHVIAEIYHRKSNIQVCKALKYGSTRSEHSVNCPDTLSHLFEESFLSGAEMPQDSTHS